MSLLSSSMGKRLKVFGWLWSLLHSHGCDEELEQSSPAHGSNPRAWEAEARGQMQVKGHSEFQGNLGYLVRPCLNVTSPHPRKPQIKKERVISICMK